jgi:hypothetical protein
MENELDTYNIFNIEHSDLILDIYNNIIDYCNPSYMEIHNKGNFSKFLNVIYNNIDLDESLHFLKTYNKYESDEEQEQEFINDYEYY